MRQKVGIAAVAAGAALAVFGSLQPLVEQGTAGRQRFVVTAWSQPDLGSDPVLHGVPVAVAAILLTASAAALLLGARLPARVAGPTRLTTLAASGGAVLVQGERTRGPDPSERDAVVHRLPDLEANRSS
jgi:hypothetical protein